MGVTNHRSQFMSGGVVPGLQQSPMAGITAENALMSPSLDGASLFASCSSAVAAQWLSGVLPGRIRRGNLPALRLQSFCSSRGMFQAPAAGARGVANSAAFRGGRPGDQLEGSQQVITLVSWNTSMRKRTIVNDYPVSSSRRNGGFQTPSMLARSAAIEMLDGLQLQLQLQEGGSMTSMEACGRTPNESLLARAGHAA